MTPTQTSGEASLYFHIPFCSKKCPYCHFYVLPDREGDKNALLKSLKQEWQKRASQLNSFNLVSLYFGGGTPLLFGPERIQEVLSWIPLQPTAEITLEANPENATAALFRHFKQSGINRISLGAQSFDDSLLKVLGRGHDAKQIKKSVEYAYAAGIDNISIDLMFDLPGQSLSQWRETLQEAVSLPISHLSLYNLTIEPNTLFFKKQQSLKKILPDPETSLAMYHLAIEELEKAGLQQYEISAFGRKSLHNTGYWTARPFLGFGPSAFSFWEKKRFRNIANLKKYSEFLANDEFPVDFEEQLTKSALQKELLAVQMRLKEGVDLGEFSARHGELPAEVYPSLEKLKTCGWIQKDGLIIRLTDEGMLFYDSVAEEIIEV